MGGRRLIVTEGKSKPLSKLFVLLDLGFHWLIRTSSDTTGLLRSVELGVLAGGPKKS